MIEMNIEVKITPRGNNEIQLQAKQFFVTFQFQSTVNFDFFFSFFFVEFLFFRKKESLG